LPLTIREAVSHRIWFILKLGLKLGLVNSVSLLNYRIELFLLEVFRGLGSVGIYSLAAALAELVWLVSTSIATATVAPAIGGDPERARDVIVRGVRFALVGSTLFAIGLGVVAIVGIEPVFGAAFEPAITPLLLLLPGVLVFGPASIISVYFSMRHGRTRHPLLTSVTSAAVTAILCSVLIPIGGANGAAISSSLGYLAGISFYVVSFARDAGIRPTMILPRWSDLLLVTHLGRRAATD
jgi:O-antigen/teichoic acid export membrane protein